MKKIGINMSHYWVIGWYWVVATNIINGLLKSNEYEFYLLSTEKKELPGSLRTKKNIHWILSDTKPHFMYRLWTQGSLLKKHNIDIFYTPDQIVPIKKVCKYISTIHDLYARINFRWLKALKFKDNRAKIYHFMHLDKIFARKSDYIITPSTASRIDIENELWIDKSKLIMTHRGMNHITPHLDTIKKDYILFPLCSDCDNHFIFRLWSEILKRHYTKEIIYWKPHSDTWNLPIIRNKNMKIITNKISEIEKEKLISESKIAIYVSEMEWFWFPPLECQKYWCPIIYHKVWSLEEVIWDSWIWLQWHVTEDYLNNIELLVNNENFYKKIQTSWYENTSKYSRNKVKTSIENIFNNI